MIITLIAAAAENNALGKDNQMIWRLPDDFKRFKLLTTGHHIIMGRKTLESMNGPLPNRTNIVITRQPNYTHEGCIIVNSLDQALAACPQNEEVFIIGGGEIYKQSIAKADKIELTRVLGISPEADAYFPLINPDEWILKERIFHGKDEKHSLEFAFETYLRK
ncbi:dihydrofolate reductase [Flavobacterium zepuense]|uniref:Dihydrofolate reductase n=1 Tax=Flavobacterium zepuense TaxID=2593302 RepID=A0A552V7H6_9FLAO|nr:dihydrofolate reductase [Flavobacterium zepuense]TRW26417.1 dihydrofolate reductase [Flavobacterium zepuense]